MTESREEYLQRINSTRTGGPAKGYSGKPSRRRKFSQAAVDGPNGAACPNCGGTQFTAKRSGLGKVGFGVLAVKSMVRCVTCGTTFKRG